MVEYSTGYHKVITEPFWTEVMVKKLTKYEKKKKNVQSQYADEYTMVTNLKSRHNPTVTFIMPYHRLLLLC